MKRLWLASAATALASGLAGGVAWADSIQPAPDSADSNRSMVTITCKTCPPVKDPTKAGDYVVQELKAGTQRIEIKELNGKMKMVRTEAWLGGSPIVFINSMPEDIAKDQDTAATQPMPGAELPKTLPVSAEPVAADANADIKVEAPAPIDASTTSAVTPEPVKAADVPAFDPNKLELRPAK